MSQLYTSYDQVPFYRKQWFFWMMYLPGLLMYFKSFPIYLIFFTAAIGMQQWFFWVMYFTVSIFPVIAIGILLFGDVYYRKKGEVKSFGLANRIVAGIIAVSMLSQIIGALTE